ncbi:MAG: flippase [Thermoplasmata archaeon]
MEETLLREEIGGSIILQYLNSITLVLAGFIFYIYVMHFFSSELVGTVTLLLAIVSLLNIFFSLGLGTGMQHYLSYFLGKNDYGIIKNIIYKFIIISVLLASAGLLFIYMASPAFAFLFFHTFKYILLIELISIDLFFTLLSGFFGSMIIGLQKFKSQAKWNIIGLIISYSLPVIFLYIFKNVSLIVIGWAAGNAFSAFVFLTILLRIISRGERREKSFPSSQIIKYSIPVFFSSLIGYGATYVDRFIVSYLLNLSLLGIYNFALLISSAISFIIGPFSTILLPKLSEMYGRGDRDSMKYSISKGIEIMSTIYVPIALLVASLSPYILLFLSNGEYLPASYPIMIVLTTGSLFVSGNILAVAIQSVRKTRIFIITSSIALLSNFTILFLLIPRMQMIGAAIGYSSVTITSFFVLLNYAKKYDVLKYEGIKILKIYSSAAIMFLLIFALQSSFTYSVAKLFIFIILGFTVYIILIKIMRTFNSEDMDFLMQLIPVKLRKYRNIAEFMFLGIGNAE